MKKYIYILVLFVFQFSTAQETIKADVQLTNEADNKTYTPEEVDVKPEYPGGMKEFFTFFKKNYIPPLDEKFKGGKTIVSFVIEKDGSLNDFKVLEDAGYGSGKGAIKTLKKCKKFSPAILGGVPVRCEYKFPISLYGNW